MARRSCSGGRCACAPITPARTTTTAPSCCRRGKPEPALALVRAGHRAGRRLPAALLRGGGPGAGARSGGARPGAAEPPAGAGPRQPGSEARAQPGNGGLMRSAPAPGRWPSPSASPWPRARSPIPRWWPPSRAARSGSPTSRPASWRSPRASARPPRARTSQAWHAGLARELAFERMLVAEARRQRAETDPEFAKERTARRKALLASLYLKEHLGQLTAPAPTELRAYLRRPPGSLPPSGPSRGVHHLQEGRAGRGPRSAAPGDGGPPGPRPGGRVLHGPGREALGLRDAPSQGPSGAPSMAGTRRRRTWSA